MYNDYNIKQKTYKTWHGVHGPPCMDSKKL